MEKWYFYIMVMVAVFLFLFALYLNIEKMHQSEIMINITKLDYLDIYSSESWSSYDEWRDFSCNLCIGGTAEHVKTGNITCPE